MEKDQSINKCRTQLSLALLYSATSNWEGALWWCACRWYTEHPLFYFSQLRQTPFSSPVRCDVISDFICHSKNYSLRSLVMFRFQNFEYFSIFIFPQHYRKTHPHFRGNTVMFNLFIPIMALLPSLFIPITVITAVKYFELSPLPSYRAALYFVVNTWQSFRRRSPCRGVSIFPDVFGMSLSSSPSSLVVVVVVNIFIVIAPAIH